MDEKHPLVHSFGHALLATVYIGAVAWFLYNIGRWFDEPDSFLAPLALLMLFVVSATIVGSLVLARPVILYLAGQKTDAAKFLIYTVGWLFLFTLIVFITLIARK